jgi:hypothetical protein
MIMARLLILFLGSFPTKFHLKTEAVEKFVAIQSIISMMADNTIRSKPHPKGG